MNIKKHNELKVDIYEFEDGSVSISVVNSEGKFRKLKLAGKCAEELLNLFPGYTKLLTGGNRD